MLTLYFYSHAGCSLCDRLEAMLAPHLAELRQRMGEEAVAVHKRDIAADPAWLEDYRTRIPVLEWNGRVLLEGRPDAEAVARAMRELTATL